MNRLRELREEKGFSLKKLGEEVDMSASVLGNYERGDRNPKVDIWEKLATYFDVSTSYIMGISKERVEPTEQLSKTLEKVILSIRDTNKNPDIKADALLSVKTLMLKEFSDYYISLLNQSDELAELSFQAFNNFSDTLKFISSNNDYDATLRLSTIEALINDIFKDDYYFETDNSDPEISIRRRRKTKDIAIEYNQYKKEIIESLDREFQSKLENLQIN